MHLLGKHIDFI